jgi:hypothetical protein
VPLSLPRKNPVSWDKLTRDVRATKPTFTKEAPTLEKQDLVFRVSLLKVRADQ